MNVQEILDELNSRASEAGESMTLAEADGNSDYDYHEGRLEAYESIKAWIMQKSIKP